MQSTTRTALKELAEIAPPFNESPPVSTNLFRFKLDRLDTEKIPLTPPASIIATASMSSSIPAAELGLEPEPVTVKRLLPDMSILTPIWTFPNQVTLKFPSPVQFMASMKFCRSSAVATSITTAFDRHSTPSTPAMKYSNSPVATATTVTMWRLMLLDLLDLLETMHRRSRCVVRIRVKTGQTNVYSLRSCGLFVLKRCLPSSCSEFTNLR